jgi:hypothetical protein
MQTVVLGHPSNGTRPNTQAHVHENLYVDVASTDVLHDDLEVCCLALTAVYIESWYTFKVFGQCTLVGFMIKKQPTANNAMTEWYMANLTCISLDL